VRRSLIERLARYGASLAARRGDGKEFGRQRDQVEFALLETRASAGCDSSTMRISTRSIIGNARPARLRNLFA